MKPLLQLKKHLYLKFAKEHKNWIVENWKHMIFTNEKKINFLALIDAFATKLRCWKGSQIRECSKLLSMVEVLLWFREACLKWDLV